MKKLLISVAALSLLGLGSAAAQVGVQVGPVGVGIGAPAYYDERLGLVGEGAKSGIEVFGLAHGGSLIGVVSIATQGLVGGACVAMRETIARGYAGRAIVCGTA